MGRRRSKAIGFDVHDDGRVTRLRRVPRVVAGDKDGPRQTPGPKKGPMGSVIDALLDHGGDAMRGIADWLLLPIEEWERIRKRNGAIVATVVVGGVAYLVHRTFNADDARRRR